MASITRRGKYWRAQVRRAGYPDQHRSFDSMAEAQICARSVETEMDRGAWVSRGEADRTTLAEALDRYGREFSARKAHHAQDMQRIRHWKRQPLAQRFLANLRGIDFAANRAVRRLTPADFLSTRRRGSPLERIIMFSPKKISLALAAAALAAGSAGARTVIIAASSDTTPQSAGAGIVMPKIPDFPSWVTNPSPPESVGSYATAPDTPIGMVAWNSRNGYYWTTTAAVYESNNYLNSAGGPASIQVPVGACVYGMGNNNPSWAAKDIQCPAGSGWLTVAYKTIYNSYAGY